MNRKKPLPIHVNRRAFLQTTGASVLAAGAAIAAPETGRGRPKADDADTPTFERTNQRATARAPIDFIVPEPGDGVGVVVAEGVEETHELRGWILDTEQTLTLRALDRVPFGHKIALQNFSKGDTILEYGIEIGQAGAGITKGRHVHVHNMTSKRWSK